MNAKDYLQQARDLDCLVRFTLLELKGLRETASGLTAAAGAAGAVRAGEPLARARERIGELEGRLEDEVSRLVTLREQVEAVINRLPDPRERTVLRCRYLLGMSWEEMGDELYCSASTLHRWHSAALKHLVPPREACPAPPRRGPADNLS